jgi:hypothetical protein
MIPDIGIGNNTEIPVIGIGNNSIQLIQTIEPTNAIIRPIGVRYISDARVWMQKPPQSIPITVPVTVNAGTPIINMPGCVKVHKENAKNPQNRNKMLVNDDPKGNTILCDAGAPYYEPAEYDYRDLTWQTIDQEPPEPEGIDAGEPPTPEFDTPEPPTTPPQTAEDVECPPPNARRIGDLNQAGTEKVTGYKLTPDGKICETQWEALGFTEQYLPSVPIVSTTATIALVATSSALLAKPLADLLLKVVKPAVKKVVAKVKQILGKKEKIQSVQERRIAQRDRNQAIQTLKKAVKK